MGKEIKGTGHRANARPVTAVKALKAIEAVEAL
jgi:hypothetical protein